MNSAGDVCGSSSFFDNTHAYLWKPTIPNGTMGGMMDLNDRSRSAARARYAAWCRAVSGCAEAGYPGSAGYSLGDWFAIPEQRRGCDQ